MKIFSWSSPAVFGDLLQSLKHRFEAEASGPYWVAHEVSLEEPGLGIDIDGAADKSQSGCSSQGDCAKGEHKCSRRKGDFVCQRTGHNRLDCDHPKLVKDGGH